MIVDASAIVAIMRDEVDAVHFAARVEAAESVRVSVATVLEAHLVLGPSRRGDLDDWLAAARAEVIPVDLSQLSAARLGHDRYGRGSGSPARLNFGDCFAYALAKTTREPLLFKGDDFTRTDVTSAR